MSKWDTFSNKSGQSGSGTTSGTSSAVNSIFSNSPTTPSSYTQKYIQPLNNKDAAQAVTDAINRNLDMCDRLPNSPTFKTEDGEIDVKDGVMGAMGSAAANLLELSQTQELSSSLGLGTSGSSNDDDDGY